MVSYGFRSGADSRDGLADLVFHAAMDEVIFGQINQIVFRDLNKLFDFPLTAKSEHAVGRRCRYHSLQLGIHFPDQLQELAFPVSNSSTGDTLSDALLDIEDSGLSSENSPGFDLG